MTRLCFVFWMIYSFHAVTAQREVLNVDKRQSNSIGLQKDANLRVSRKDPEAISVEDFTIDAPGESAIYLVNNGYTKINYDYRKGFWQVSSKRLMRILILTEEGLGLGNVKIPLIFKGKSTKEHELIRDVKAVTYSINETTGEIDSAAVNSNDIFTIPVNDRLKEVSFAMPNVRVNSILHIMYITDSPFLSGIDSWYFQKEHPVRSSWFTFLADGPFRYVYELQGQEQLTQAQTNDIRGITSLGRLRPMKEEWWVTEDIPAYKNESYTTTEEDYITKLSFQLESAGIGKNERSYLKDWFAVTHDLQQSKRFKLFYAGKRNFDLFDIPESGNALENATEIYDRFKTQFSWDKKFGVYPNVSFREMVKQHSGNTSSMGLTLFQILDQAGFEVRPILCSPRFNGKINEKYPFVDKLIATVVRLKIREKTYLLDPIHDVPFGHLHQDFLNDKGLVLDDVVVWQDLTIDANDYKTSEVSISVSEDFIKADLALNMKDYGVVSIENEPIDLFKSDWEVSDIVVEENELTAQRLTAKIQREIEDDLILIPLSFDKVVFSENPFKSEDRLYPIDFLYKKKYGYKLEVKLSDEFEFDANPESQLVKTSDGKLSAVLNVNQIGQSLNLTFLFWTKSNSFDVAYYPHLQSAYELMAELADGFIIVKRKP